MILPPFFANNALWEYGHSIVVILLLCSMGALCIRRLFLLYPIFLLFAFSLYFFRVPHRECAIAKSDSAVILSPADGKIVDVCYLMNPSVDDFVWKIAIFLSPFDVHINWIPTPGIIDRIIYRPGTFYPAFVPKSSQLNERCDIYVQGMHQRKYIVRQIAGAVARRIVCWVREGNSMQYGDTYGMIRFGSRVELLLPANVQIEVGIGQHVYGGSTIIGRWL